MATMTTSPPSSTREVATMALIESLKERFPSQGFRLHSDVKFRGQATGHMGVVTTRAIAKDEILLVIPDSTRFTAPNVSKHVPDAVKQALNKVKHRLEHNPPHIHGEYYFDNGDVLLALLIMYAQHNPELAKEFQWQAATWPSQEEMKVSSILYLDANPGHGGGGAAAEGQSFLVDACTKRIQNLQQFFQTVVRPVLEEEPGPANQFYPKENNSDHGWEAFRYAFSLVWSRGHQGGSGPELLPLVELFNGHSSASSSDINVSLSKGQWPFLHGSVFRNDCNLDCSAIYATRDLEAGEELYLSYGNLIPSSFLLKYGTIPRSLATNTNMMDTVALWCPPHLVPTDPWRIQALTRCGFPIPDLRAGMHVLTILTDQSLQLYRTSGQESEHVKSLRQFLILGQLATDDEVQVNLRTGRLRVANLARSVIGQLLHDTIDYNLDRLQGSDSKSDVALSETKLGIESGLLLGRVCQRETLLQWKHLFAQNYGLPFDPSCCQVCGRSYPLFKCSRCKRAMYCSREHQKKDFKQHKGNCKLV